MRIGILDHMGYGNLGDAATQDVVIESIKRRIPDVQLVAFSQVPADTAHRHNIICYPISWGQASCGALAGNGVSTATPGSRMKAILKRPRLLYSLAKALLDFGREVLSWWRSFQILKSLDIMIISGGGQFSDLWNGPWSHPYALFKFCLLTKIAGKKVYILNVGAGPLNHRLSRLFAAGAVSLADYRSFRDDDSQERIRTLGISSRLVVCADSVYGLKVQELPTEKAFTASKVVGINPMGFCDPRVWPRKNDSIYHKYLDKVTQFSLWLLDHGYSLQVFSTDMITDHYAIEDLRTRLSSVLSPAELSQSFAGGIDDVQDLLQKMAEFDFVVTCKYHGIVFSHLLNKPVISLSYGPKMDSAMEAVGQGRFNANIEHFEVDWMINAFRSLINDSESVKRQSSVGVMSYAAKLARQFDNLFLPSTSVR